MKVQNQQNIKVNNLMLVLRLIKEQRGREISRADIAKMTKMSATSISRIVDNLVRAGMIKETSPITAGRVGRKGTCLVLQNDKILSLGISIDSDRLGMCILDFTDQILEEETYRLQRETYQPEQILQFLFEMYEKLFERCGISQKAVKSIGISCIGNIDPVQGKIYFAPQFGWNEVDFASLAEKYFSGPVFMENDMKAATVSVVRNSGQMAEGGVTYLSIGMGVGSSVYMNGKVLRGYNNALGEVGHLIIHPHGRLCDCGQRGCVQTSLTMNSLIEICHENGKDAEDLEEIIRLYRKGDPWMAAFVKERAMDLTYLIRNLIYMYNTEYILVGGALIVKFPELFELALEKLPQYVHPNLLQGLKIVKAETENNSLSGAAMIAQERYVERILRDYKSL